MDKLGKDLKPQIPAKKCHPKTVNVFKLLELADEESGEWIDDQQEQVLQQQIEPDQIEADPAREADPATRIEDMQMSTKLV